MDDEIIGEFRTKVRGVSHKNKDGQSRQSIIRRCQPGEQLVLKRERNNPYSRFAIAIHCLTGHQVGYLSEELAEQYAGRLDDGAGGLATILNVSGGGDKFYGLNIEVTIVSARSMNEARASGIVEKAEVNWVKRFLRWLI